MALMLHGTLNVTILEATGLNSDDSFHEELYVTVDIGETEVGQTRLVDYKSNFQWDEKLQINCAHKASNVVFTLKDYSNDPFVGKANLPVTNIIGGEEVDNWFDVLDKNDEIIKKGSQLHVKVQFIDVISDSNWNCGIKTPKFPGVPCTYFTQKNQCKVTLYQDAHVLDSFVPNIPLSDAKVYEQHRCWEDIFDAITNAKYFIYITGWSVVTKITLIRDTRRPKPDEAMTLGELLKKKASEGVRVLMLVWDDYTGMMGTHDKETKQYFENTQVHCVLCPRNDNKAVEFLFAHHQKAVVVDSKLPSGDSNQRRIMSFVGGIDLCDGRYDNQSHSLFKTLNTVHKNDFYQKNFEDASIEKGGPRQPWHDIHSRLEGPAAWDVLINFEQRWRKQGTDKDLLVDVQDTTKFVLPSFVTFPDDHETWNVQVFRSIDSNDVVGLPDFPNTDGTGLLSGPDGVYDRSIQGAYVHAIRRAKRFIYIENQYFLGSSFDWKEKSIPLYGEINANHLVPKELSLKIISKIEKGERFTVYVVLPMWPEGIPDSLQIQDILRWQRNTIEMMYTDVANALRAHNSKAKPEEYLSFFCLGNREIKSPGEYEPPEKPEPNTDYSRAQVARRFMIYVHAKMMIVDDEYIIVGSANINERSMNGARDSEIAMGAFQPNHIWHEDKPARGEIHGFRMSLWHEHLNPKKEDDIEVFLAPQSERCVTRVNQLAQENWESYISDEVVDLPRHLLKYPIRVNEDGNINYLPGWENFPDTRGSVLGAEFTVIPPIITLLNLP